MSMRSLIVSACLAAATIGFGGAASAAASDHCFLSQDWQSWKSPDPDTIYVRVGVSQIYKLSLSSGSDQLQQPDVHLVTDIRGSNWICSPLDLQMRLVDNFGAFSEPIIVKSITRLTPEEVAAIPKKYLP